MIGAILHRWQAFWFAPKEAVTLGVCRILFFGMMFWEHLGQHWAAWAEMPREFWQPIWLFRTFHVDVLPAPALLALEIAWKVALFGAFIGLFTRLSTAAAFGIGFYLLGLRHNWGKLSHDDAAIVFIMLIMALSRCGDALSLDALLRRRGRSTLDGPALPLDSGEYRWPMRAVWLVLAMVFFNSAVAKLRRSGWGWALSENLSVLMVRLNYFNKPRTDWGLHLANLRGFGQVMAMGALLTELLFPLILFSRVARWILVPAAFLMQVGNKLLLGVDFTIFMSAYVFFIDWGWLWSRLRPRGRSDAPQPITESTPSADVPAPVEAESDAFAQRRAQVHRTPPPLGSPL